LKARETEALLTKTFSLLEDLVVRDMSSKAPNVDLQKDYIVIARMLNRRVKFVFDIDDDVVMNWYVANYSHIVHTDAFGRSRKVGTSKTDSWLDNLVN
jgi:hypothetical protein